MKILKVLIFFFKSLPSFWSASKLSLENNTNPNSAAFKQNLKNNKIPLSDYELNNVLNAGDMIVDCFQEMQDTRLGVLKDVGLIKTHGGFEINYDGEDYDYNKAYKIFQIDTDSKMNDIKLFTEIILKNNVNILPKALPIILYQMGSTSDAFQSNLYDSVDTLKRKVIEHSKDRNYYHLLELSMEQNLDKEQLSSFKELGRELNRRGPADELMSLLKKYRRQSGESDTEM